MTQEQIAEFNRRLKEKGSDSELIYAGPAAPPRGPVHHVTRLVTYEFLHRYSPALKGNTPEEKALYDALGFAMQIINGTFKTYNATLPDDVMIYRSKHREGWEFEFKFTEIGAQRQAVQETRDFKPLFVTSDPRGVNIVTPWHIAKIGDACRREHLKFNHGLFYTLRNGEYCDVESARFKAISPGLFQRIE